jgi:hypothetical protein
VSKDIVVVLFSVTAGFTASGIMANLYRLIARQSDTMSARIAYVAVMVVAGPSVLFENAAAAWRTKSCSQLAFWLATAICAYWSLALGLLVLNVAIVLR